MKFIRAVEGRVERGIHGPPQVFGEVASIFVTTRKDLQEACFSDAWTARLVLLGFRPHPKNSAAWDGFAEKAQVLAWRRFLKWIITRSKAGSIEEIVKIAESDIIGSRSSTAGAR